MPLLQVPAITENVIYMVGSVASATAFLTWFIANQFGQNCRVFYRVISRHNKEDDDRFAAINESIWQIHLRNARRDGDKPPPQRPFPRRRYLIETDGESAENSSTVNGSE